MDQNALLVLIVAALLAERTPTPPSERYLVRPVEFCHMVNAAKPQITDINIESPNLKQLSIADRDMLQKLAEFMRQNDCGVRVEGYTDLVAKNNKTPDAQERANIVSDYLTNGLPEPQRVPADHVRAEGKGVLDTTGLSAKEKRIAKIVL